MFKVIILLFFSLLITHQVFAECYLTVIEEGNYSPKMLISLSAPLISKYIEPVNEIPAKGINSKECVYSVSLVETRSSLSYSLISSRVNISGKSKKNGVEGIRQALLRAFLQNDPTKKQELCKNHPTDLSEDCLDINVLHLDEQQNPKEQNNKSYETDKKSGKKIKIIPFNQLSSTKYEFWKDLRIEMFSLIEDYGEISFNYSVTNSSSNGYYFTVMAVGMDSDKNILWSVGTGENYQEKRTTETFNDSLLLDNTILRKTSFIWIRAAYNISVD